MYGVRLGPCHGRTTRARPTLRRTSSVLSRPPPPGYGGTAVYAFRSVHQLLVFLAACAGGAINSVAGGGTLLTVPTLIWLGVPAINANATSTVALWPGSLSGAWGFRREMRQADSARLRAGRAEPDRRPRRAPSCSSERRRACSSG